MSSQRRILALIPARGGSERLPGKNILSLRGKPLINWTIDAALGSRCIDRTVVSTDSQEIAEIARQGGADVPFRRPAELASDTAATVDVVLHAVDCMEEAGDFFEDLIVLQPTSPLRGSKEIDEALRYYYERNAESVVGVCEVDHSPLWTNMLPEDKSMNGFIEPALAKVRSQDLPKYYRINGAIYIIAVDALQRKRTLFPGESSFAWIMNTTVSIDIDTEMDFRIAEALFGLREDA